LIDFRLAPLPGNCHPPFDLGLQSRIIGAQVKRVEPVDDIPHQVAHLIVGDTRNLGSRDAVAVSIDDCHVAPVADLGGWRSASMRGLEVSVQHAKRRKRDS
jgi:hypothetical protein